MKKMIIKNIKKRLEFDGINLDKKHVEINNKKYKIKEYLSISSNFANFSEEIISLKNKQFNNRIDVIYNLFLANVFISTKFGLIFPCFVFLLISLISFSSASFFQTGGNFGFGMISSNQISFLYFLSVFMFIIFMIYLYFIVVKKQRLFYTKKSGQNRYVHLSKNEYENMCKIFEINMEKNDKKFPFLESNRIRIRQFTINDVNDVFEFMKNEQFVRYLNMNKAENDGDAINFVYSRLKEYYKNNYFMLAIEKINEKKVIGFIGLSKMDYSIDTCQIIYGISEEYWHQGVGTEAVNLYIRYLKDTKIKYIFAGHVEENIYSGKVMLKNGFIRYPIKDYITEIKGKLHKINTYILYVGGDNCEE